MGTHRYQPVLLDRAAVRGSQPLLKPLTLPAGGSPIGVADLVRPQAGSAPVLRPVVTIGPRV